MAAAGDENVIALALFADVEHRGAVRIGDRLELRRPTEKHAAVERDDMIDRRRSWRRNRRRLRDERFLVLGGERKGVVETPLETDRRGCLRVHGGAAERPGNMAWIDLDAVRKLEQPAQAPAKAARSLEGRNGEIRPRGIAYEERVPGQDEPGLFGPGTIADREAAVLRPVPRRVQDADDGRTQLELRAVLERLERKLRLGGGVNADRRPVLERQPPVPGDVIGVRVSLQDTCDPHLSPLRLAYVGVDLVGRVDDERLAAFF